MKKIYVSDVKRLENGTPTLVKGWVSNKRVQKTCIFLTVTDSTGDIQVVFDAEVVTAKLFQQASAIPVESAVSVMGKVSGHLNNRTQENEKELLVSGMEIIGEARYTLSPPPRSDLNIFDPALTKQLLDFRHFYLRNPKVMAILKFRHWLTGAVHGWFRENNFIEITAPTLTVLPLYDDGSALSLEIDNEKVFLTQCVGFYLESAVHAFERVYNLGPSFRGEESRSKRHLMEYWHIKAELAFGDLDDIMNLVEDLIRFVSAKALIETEELTQAVGGGLNLDGLKPPFPRLPYAEAVELLQHEGVDFEFGKSLGSEEEEIISRNYDKPLWVVGIPRTIEPFPYVIDSEDPRLTRTADLIATRGYGELLGVAEKIHDPAMLDERMTEKGKIGNELYQWLRDLRNYGCVPHIGFGLGLERFIRWLMQIEHVRDAMPFPRTFRRKVRP